MTRRDETARHTAAGFGISVCVCVRVGKGGGRKDDETDVWVCARLLGAGFGEGPEEQQREQQQVVVK